jgi:hypothetical protein
MLFMSVLDSEDRAPPLVASGNIGCIVMKDDAAPARLASTVHARGEKANRRVLQIAAVLAAVRRQSFQTQSGGVS